MHQAAAITSPRQAVSTQPKRKADYRAAARQPQQPCVSGQSGGVTHSATPSDNDGPKATAKSASPNACSAVEQIAEEAGRIGLDPAAVTERMTQGAANAWQKRAWTRQDLLAVAAQQRLDLDSDTGRKAAADLVGGFYAATARLVDRSLERRPENDRLTRALGAMTESLRDHGTVAFQSDAHAARFARDLKDRYGEDLMARLAEGEDRALALDIPDPKDRQAAVRAIAAAAERHESIGMTLQQARQVKERGDGREAGGEKRERER